MRIAEILEALRDFFSHRRLEDARKRHKRAADRLDAAVKEILKR